ncbi:hypothetical protein PVAP13_1NG170157 [Panicum virgatum]|uniref:Uncharacterized protein n=1 Tax=Panicum virgatum TaxID=38727 RepID=A0A8T0WNU0_PANVG|nr:hypothetical protein PVAP13_1NG170157 [Panicum virgatum]
MLTKKKKERKRRRRETPIGMRNLQCRSRGAIPMPLPKWANGDCNLCLCYSQSSPIRHLQTQRSSRNGRGRHRRASEGSTHRSASNRRSCSSACPFHCCCCSLKN